MGKKAFKFYSDPAHGWLAVSMKEAAAVGLTATSFSSYSYQRGNTFYLEEDCDASVFIDAYVAKHGQKPAFIEQHTDKSHPIRSYETIW